MNTASLEKSVYPKSTIFCFGARNYVKPLFGENAAVCLAVEESKNCMLFALIEEFGKLITVPVHYRKWVTSPF